MIMRMNDVIMTRIDGASARTVINRTICRVVDRPLASEPFSICKLIFGKDCDWAPAAMTNSRITTTLMITLQDVILRRSFL